MVLVLCRHENGSKAAGVCNFGQKVLYLLFYVQHETMMFNQLYYSITTQTTVLEFNAENNT